MQIASSNVQFQSRHAAIERHERNENLRVWRDTAKGRVSEELSASESEQHGRLKAMALAISSNQASIGVELSSQAQSLQPQRVSADLDEMEPTGKVEGIEISVVRMLVEKITGRKFVLFDPNEFQQKVSQAETGAAQQASGQAAQGAAQGAEQREGWGMVYDAYESHYESESTTFSAQGVVKTADGQEIEFQVDLNMSREFMEQNSVNIRAGDALKDPLVINFDGNAAELTSKRFSFDIDADGREDQIAFVRPGSGFLAVDQNEDGVVNDGSELFGPTTGNGFSELAAHDADGNQWIDENDPIYSRLRVWTRDESGNDQLFALGQQGIGAVYLGNAKTPFALKDEQNEQLGAIRSSGIYLNENGSVGTVQQVDLVV